MDMWMTWCHGCGQRMTRCHCMVPRLKASEPGQSHAGAWWLLALTAAGAALWWAGWLKAAVLGLLVVSAIVMTLLIVIVTAVALSEDVGRYGR